MFLSKLIFQTGVNAARYEYRFKQGSGKFSSTYICQGENDELQLMLNALKYCFKRHSQHEISYTFLEFRDNSGDLWAIEKTPENTRYIRNQETIRGDNIQESLLAALLDLDLSNPDASQSDIQTLDVNQVFDIGSELYKRKADLHSMDHLSEASQLTRESISLLGEIHKALPGNTLAPEAYIELIKEAEGLKVKYDTISQLEKDLRLPTKHDSKDLLYANKILNELKIISEIEYCLGFYDSYKKEKQTLLSEKTFLNNKLQSIDHLEFKLKNSNCPWSQIIRILSQLRICDTIDKTFVSLSKNAVEPVISSHGKVEENFSSIKNELSKLNIQIDAGIAEIKNKVSNKKLLINEKINISEEFRSKEPAEIIISWFKKIFPSFSILARDGSNQTKALPEAQDSELNTLFTIEKSFRRIKGTINNYNRFYSHDFQKTSTLLNQLTVHIKKIRAIKTELENRWDSVSTKYQLDKNMTVETIVDHLQLVGYAHELDVITQRLQSLDSKIEGQISRISKLIDKWRATAGSVKITRLDTAQGVLNEAKAICRFKHEKEKLLIGYTERMTNAQIPTLIQRNYDSEKDRLSKLWSEIFHSKGITPIAISSPDVNEIAIKARQLHAILNLESMSNQNQFTIINQTESEGAPLQAFFFGGISSRNDDIKLAFTEFLRNVSNQSCNLLLMNDPLSIDIGLNLGCGFVQKNSSYSEPIKVSTTVREFNAQRQNAQRPVSRTSSLVNHDGLLSEKAEKALMLLNSTYRKP